MMTAKGETQGGRGPRGFDDFLDSFLDTNITKPGSQGPADDEDGSDDLRLDDFIGISEVDNDPSERGSTTSSCRRSKRLRKKKHASPVIVVEGVDGTEVEGVTLKDAGNEKGEMEETDGGGGGLKEETTDVVSDTEMDFTVLEVASSHLNLDVSKQKTSLRKKGSLARRKRPTRSTISLPTDSSDSIFGDSTDGTPGVTFPAKADAADDGDLSEQTNLDSPSGTVDVKKKYIPKKPPMIVPGLQDLTESKLFNKERKNTSEEFPPTGKPSSSAVSSPLDSRPWRSSGNLSESDVNAAETWSSTSTSALNFVQENDAQLTSGLKSQYKSPVWLSEMKAKTSTTSGESSTARSGTDKENSTVSNTSPPAGNVSHSVESSRREGLGGRGLSPEMKKGGEKEAEKPVWMRKALEKTSRVADRLQGQKDRDNRQTEEDEKRAAPPWEAELKRKNRPLVAPGQTTTTNQSERAETPSKYSSETRARDVYTPSWMKRAGPSPADSGKAKATSGSPAPSQTSETPKWKLDLAEKKKRRQVETTSSPDGKSQTSEGSASDTSSQATDTSSPSPSSQPAWRQQLIQRRKTSIPTTDKERPLGKGGEGGGSPSPDWARQVEERRARLLKSGLIDKGADESHC